MKRKIEFSTLITIAISLFVLLFGDDLYQQFTGRSFGGDFRAFFFGQATQTQENTRTFKTYDAFDNPDYDKKFDSLLWSAYNNNAPNQIEQINGILFISSEKSPDLFVGLIAREYNIFKLGQEAATGHFSLYARIKQDKTVHSGNVLINIGAILPTGDSYLFQCNNYSDGRANCWDKNMDQVSTEEYSIDDIYVNFGTWHAYQIDIDTQTFKVTYFIDDVVVGSHIPYNVNDLKSSDFWVSVGVWSDNQNSTIGYLDDIKIGYGQ